MLKKVVTFLIIIVLTASMAMPVLADSISQMQDKKEDAQKEQKEVKTEKSAIMKEVEDLGLSIEENEQKLGKINTQLINLNKEVKELKADLEEAEKHYQKQETALEQKIVMDYEKGETNYLDVLLNSKGILDFLSNYYFISEIVKKDTELLDSIEEQKRTITNNKKKLEEKQRSVKTQKAEQEKVNVVLNNQKSQKNNKIAELSKEEKDLQKQIDEYDEMIREAERKASQLASGSSGVFVGGDKVWPCPASSRITSYYGGRNTGIPGATTNHKGIDIGCPVGSAVVSVLDGRVLFTGFNRARGYYIMIDHGGGVVTLYQHCSQNSFKVSVGDRVKAGQTIVLSGNTGIGSGPHLHFEVLINGTNVNPLEWLRQG